jgi:hypothetical protein
MLKILFIDGTEKKCKGRIKFYSGSQPALCHFDLDIEGRNRYDTSNLKLVYDTETNECVYFSYCSYRFCKGEEYKELYNKSKRELQ